MCNSPAPNTRCKAYRWAVNTIRDATVGVVSVIIVAAAARVHVTDVVRVGTISGTQPPVGGT